MELVRQALAKISVESIRKHVEVLEGVRHPVSAPAALEQARVYVSDVLKTLGYSMEQHRFLDNDSEFSNVIATRRGRLFPKRRLLVVAHYDTVSNSPGADDNASGVAVLLEIASVLSTLSMEKTVQFVAVNLEENADEAVSGTGLRGSRALAARAKEEGWEIDGVLVLESVAFASETAVQTTPAGLPLEVPSKGNFLAAIGNESSNGLLQAFSQAVKRHGAALPVVPLAVPGNGEMLRDTRRSDHAPFWDHGFQAVMLTDTTNFRNPHYHEPSDTLDTLNLSFAAEVCRATAGCLMDLAGGAEEREA
ncbi:Peptidase M28 [Citrifermentans bremense]|uniref:Peptidase M28 n=1 Tax=Citrifermentans bremense TaxID=60035 RepID=A0A6S6LZ48_9BACT|nr:M28 family peptidase [Citrifermentans bremense]BCG46240.1 Peptidase M28 [Citrifermentans bremense]